MHVGVLTIVMQGTGSIGLYVCILLVCTILYAVLALAGVVCEIPIVTMILDWMWHSVVGVQDWWRE